MMYCPSSDQFPETPSNLSRYYVTTCYSDRMPYALWRSVELSDYGERWGAMAELRVMVRLCNLVPASSPEGLNQDDLRCFKSVARRFARAKNLTGDGQRTPAD